MTLRWSKRSISHNPKTKYLGPPPLRYIVLVVACAWWLGGLVACACGGMFSPRVTAWFSIRIRTDQKGAWWSWRIFCILAMATNLLFVYISIGPNWAGNHCTIRQAQQTVYCRTEMETHPERIAALPNIHLCHATCTATLRYWLLYSLDNFMNMSKERLNKKTIESVIMIIPRRTPTPSFLRTVIALGYFFCIVFLWIG